MECWSMGALEGFKCSTPLLHHSSIPVLVKENPSANGGGVVRREEKLAATSV